MLTAAVAKELCKGSYSRRQNKVLNSVTTVEDKIRF